MAMDVGGGGLKADINITPLVDVVLVLLIIFMVITPLMTKSLPLLVPKKAELEEPTEEMKRQVVVHLFEDNHIEVNHRPVELSELKREVEAGLRLQKIKLVFFEADDNAMYGQAVLVMDIIKSTGINAVGIMTGED